MSSPTSDSQPAISVVVPTYARPAQLARCIAALEKQTIGRAMFEVIICDDGSPEPTLNEIATEVDAARLRMTIRLVCQANAGPGAARNYGASLARAPLIAFLDDDCEPAADWLQQLLRAHVSAPDALIVGNIHNSLVKNRYSVATHTITDFVRIEQERSGGIRRFGAANLCVRGDAFLQTGGFEPSYDSAEDHEFTSRWQAQGRRAVMQPDAIVFHAHELTLRTFVRQHMWYGQGLARYWTHRSRFAQRKKFGARPGAGFYFRLILFPLGRDGWRGIGTAILIVLSQVATSAGALTEVLRWPQTKRQSPRGRARRAI